MHCIMSVIHKAWGDPTKTRSADIVGDQRTGVITIWDLALGRRVVEVPADSPTGMALVDGDLLVASMYGGYLSRRSLDSLGETSRLEHPLFSDLHTLSMGDGGVLVTSSGLDCIIELSTDLNRTRWLWNAHMHGLNVLPDGRTVSIDLRQDYMGKSTRTDDQTTHVNCALAWGQYVLATLFWQGTLIRINRSTGSYEELVQGLGTPHSLRRRPFGGWTICDTSSDAVLLLDDSFEVVDSIRSDFSWVQDAVDLDGSRLWILDANHHRVVEWDLDMAKELRSLEYPSNWKGFGLFPLADKSW
jgi:hypothetical protein